MNKTKITEDLDLIRTRMGDIATEAKGRMHEPIDTHNHHLRIFVMITEIAEALRKVSWALMREIDPHS